MFIASRDNNPPEKNLSIFSDTSTLTPPAHMKDLSSSKNFPRRVDRSFACVFCIYQSCLTLGQNYNFYNFNTPDTPCLRQLGRQPLSRLRRTWGLSFRIFHFHSNRIMQLMLDTHLPSEPNLSLPHPLATQFSLLYRAQG